ncbi:Uncharacterised protein [Proteus mirabilis]|uniref:Uncharacterized protein n=1 Tax=Proteus mirabilis TaxID=584 RepID=A0A2X2BGE2_PROMI|nr:Uncharacterised protein [Proteus mirabilis]
MTYYYKGPLFSCWDLLVQWYKRRFADPQVIALVVILIAGFSIIYFFSGILAPLLVAIVLAYLLEWPTHLLEKLGCARIWARINRSDTIYRY